MSERLEKELDKLKYAKITKVNDNEYFIKKEEGTRLVEDSSYLIKLQPQLLNANNNIAINWNKGVYPKCLYYQVEIQKVMGNMIKVLGVGCSNQSFSTIEDNFIGWLPIDFIEVIQQV